MNSVDSNHFACFSKENKNLYVSQVKTGNNKMDFEELKLADLTALASTLDLTLVWSTKEIHLLKSSTETSSNKMNLYLFSKLGLLKKIENVDSLSFLVKDQNQFLVYAKYLGTSVRIKLSKLLIFMLFKV